VHRAIVAPTGVRLVLKTAIRHEWLDHLRDLSPPYRTQGKVAHRAWFSPDEYKQLYQATREYARTARADHRWEAEQLHEPYERLHNRPKPEPSQTRARRAPGPGRGPKRTPAGRRIQIPGAHGQGVPGQPYQDVQQSLDADEAQARP
jgi:hypothetical protein